MHIKRPLYVRYLSTEIPREKTKRRVVRAKTI